MKLEEASAKIKELFGWVNDGSGGEYLGATGILQFGPQFGYKHKGKADCRGVVCEKFQTCIKHPEEKTTVEITYFWSGKNKILIILIITLIEYFIKKQKN